MGVEEVFDVVSVDDPVLLQHHRRGAGRAGAAQVVAKREDDDVVIGQIAGAGGDDGCELDLVGATGQHGVHDVDAQGTEGGPYGEGPGEGVVGNGADDLAAGGVDDDDVAAAIGPRAQGRGPAPGKGHGVAAW